MPEISTARRGLNALLERYKDAEIALITNQQGEIRSALREALHPSGGHKFDFDMHGPWTCVDLYFHEEDAPSDEEYAQNTATGTIRRFAIWNCTGDIYTIDSEGHHSETPLVIDQGELENRDRRDS